MSEVDEKRKRLKKEYDDYIRSNGTNFYSFLYKDAITKLNAYIHPDKVERWVKRSIQDLWVKKF